MTNGCTADRVADMLNLLRGQWLTRYRIEQETGFARSTVNRWVLALCAQGLLIERVADTQHGQHATVLQYTVAPAWQGLAR